MVERVSIGRKSFDKSKEFRYVNSALFQYVKKSFDWSKESRLVERVSKSRNSFDKSQRVSISLKSFDYP